jgi:hypothetical protein
MAQLEYSGGNVFITIIVLNELSYNGNFKKSLRTVLLPYDSTRIGVDRWRWRQDFILQFRGGADDRLFASD